MGAATVKTSRKGPSLVEFQQPSHFPAGYLRKVFHLLGIELRNWQMSASFGREWTNGKSGHTRSGPRSGRSHSHPARVPNVPH